MSFEINPFTPLIHAYKSQQVKKEEPEGNGDDGGLPVLRLTKDKETGEKKLELVSSSQVGRWDRFLRWIGFGPLSLKNIAKYIDEHKDELTASRNIQQIKSSGDEALDDVEPEGLSSENLKDADITKKDFVDFTRFILDQYAMYNAHRPVNRVSATKIDALDTLAKSKVDIASAQLSNTYEKDEPANEENIDFCYASESYNFAYVADSVGHKRKEKNERLASVYEEFNQSYSEAISRSEFASVDEAQDFVRAQLAELAKSLEQKGGDTPAISLAQIVEVEGKKYLITAQVADTLIVIKRGDEFIPINTHDTHAVGLGSSPLQVECTEIFPGDEVIGFSDGVGEFLTEEEFIDIVNDNSDRSRLLDDIRDFITDEERKQDLEDTYSEEERKGMQIWGGSKLKVHDWDDTNGYDDLSLFVLRCTPSDE